MELTSLKQSSPYFRLLSRSRQPDKGGHFSSPTLPAIKGKGGSYLSFRARAIARRGISMSSRTRHRRCEGSHTICSLGGRCFATLSMTSSCREILQGKAFQNDIALRGRNTWQEILPPCSRQNDIHLAKDSSFHFVLFRMTSHRRASTP